MKPCRPPLPLEPYRRPHPPASYRGLLRAVPARRRRLAYLLAAAACFVLAGLALLLLLLIQR